MSVILRLNTPLTDAGVLRLNVGDQVLLSGVIYTARDAAHKRMVEVAAGGRGTARSRSKAR